MPQSLARVILHTVFSTKERFPIFQNPAFRAEVHAYLGGCAKSLDCLPIQIGGAADHVHLLTTLPRTLAIADFITGWEAARPHVPPYLRRSAAISSSTLSNPAWICAAS